MRWRGPIPATWITKVAWGHRRHVRLGHRPPVRVGALLCRHGLVALALATALAVAVLAAAPPGPEASADSSSDDLETDQLQVLDGEPPMPSWLGFAGGQALNVSATLEGTVVAEFGHETTEDDTVAPFDPDRFASADPYRGGPEGVQSAVLADLRLPEEEDTRVAVGVTDDELVILGPQTAGYPVHGTWEVADHVGVPVGVAVFRQSDDTSHILVVGSDAAAWYAWTEGALSLLEATAMLTEDFSSGDVLDVYQRPAWQHYEHEGPLSDRALAIVARVGSPFHLRVARLKYGTDGTLSVEDERIVESDASVRDARVRYDADRTHLGLTGRDNVPNYHMAVLHTVDGDRHARLSRFDPGAGGAGSGPVPGEAACPSDEPDRVPDFAFEVLDLEISDTRSGNNQFSQAVVCAGVETIEGAAHLRVELHRRDVFGEGAKVYEYESAHVDSRRLSSTAQDLRRPTVQVTHPCPGWLTTATLLQGQEFKCHDENGPPDAGYRDDNAPRRWSTDFFLRPTTVAAHVLARDTGPDGDLVLATRSWSTPPLCTDRCRDPLPADADVLTANDRIVESGLTGSVDGPIVALPLEHEPIDLTIETLSKTGSPVETGEPVPVALLVAPPTVAGAHQDVAEPEFARARAAGSGRGVSTTHEVEILAGLDVEDPTGSNALLLQASVGSALSDESGVARTVEITDFYNGRDDEHVVVYNTFLGRKVAGRVVESSTGLGVSDTPVPIIWPEGMVTTARTLSSFRARFKETFERLQTGLEGAFPRVGDPSSYPQYQSEAEHITSAAIDDYCIGQLGPGPSLDRPPTAAVFPNPFLENPELPSGDDVLVGNQRFVSAGEGGSVVSGSVFDITDENSQSRVVEFSVGGVVGIRVGYFAVEASYKHTWGGTVTTTLSNGVNFSAGIGTIPNAELDDERYSWLAFLCQHPLTSDGGDELPVWVLNYAVSGYEGTGGLRPLSPVDLTAPVHSTVASTIPSFSFHQDSGTVRSYQLDLEAVGTEDRRTQTDLLKVTGTVDANQRDVDQVVSWEEVDFTDPLLPDQLYRWRVTAVDFFDNRETSAWEFFRTEAPPRADFTWTPASPDAGQEVTFTDRTEGFGHDVARQWSFGNGATATGATATTTFGSAALYPVTLDVVTDLGEDQVTRMVAVGPAANDDAYTTAEDTPLKVDADEGVLANDDDARRARLGTAPSLGAVDLAEDGSFTYTPDPDECTTHSAGGPDTFTYEAVSGNLMRVASVHIDITCVNDPPVAGDMDVDGLEDQAVEVAAPGLLALVTDPDPDDQHTLAVHAEPANGEVTLADHGAFTYTPQVDWCGTDSFTWTATDLAGKVSDPGTVTIDVECVPKPPRPEPDTYTAPVDGQLETAAPGVLGNDTDPHDEELEVVGSTPPDHGTVDLRSDGSFTYTPDPGYEGGDAFTYEVENETGLSATAEVTLTVAPADVIPTARDDRYRVRRDDVLVVDPPGVLTNDSAPSGDPLTAEIVRPPQGIVTLQADGGFEYRPPEGFTGTDTFEYRASDGTYTSTPATVHVRVAPGLLDIFLPGLPSAPKPSPKSDDEREEPRRPLPFPFDPFPFGPLRVPI